MEVKLYRILGNDLYPRHVENQTLTNLQYQLANEEEFDDVEKIWIVNRIVDADYEAQILGLLGDRKKLVIDFNPDIYSQQTTFEDKYHYITNVNPARNLAIERGFQEGADIVMPFDGNCFFTPEGWYHTRNTIANNFLSPYFIVPMSRCQFYSDVAQQPMTKEVYTFGQVKKQMDTEPQIAFGRDHDIRFNNRFKYSEASKVELLWKLAIPGAWEYWYPRMQAEAIKNMSVHASRDIIYAGYVYRLPSGNVQAETCNVARGADRTKGLMNIVEQADAAYV